MSEDASRASFMAHMKGFSDAAGFRGYKVPEQENLTIDYQIGYNEGKEAYRMSSKRASELYGYSPLEIKLMRQKQNET